MANHSKTELNKIRLLNEGIEQFSKYGFNGIGLKDILGAVKIPKGSFYHYFENKEDFGARVIDYYTEITQQLLAETFANTNASGLDALQQFFDMSIKMHLSVGNKHGCLASNLGAEISHTSEVCRTAVERSMDITHDAFKVVIRRGQEDGSIRQDISSSVLADILLNSFEGALLRMKIEKSGEALAQFHEVMLGKFFAVN